MAGDAVRLAQRVDRVAVQIGDRLAHHLVGGAAVEFHVTRHRKGVGAPLLDRLADVESLDPGKVLDARLDEFAEPGQQPAALRCGQSAPVPGERPLGRLDRRVDVGAPAARDRPDLDRRATDLPGEGFHPTSERPSGRR